jgi:hypothetical protein
MKKLFLFILFFSNLASVALGENFIYPFGNADRDPFYPLLTDKGIILIKKATDITALVLQGIMFSNTDASVIIKNEIYHEGDFVDKYKIIKITTSGITITDNTQEYFIKWEG